MTEKKIFAYKLFLSFNISDLNLFFMWKLNPPEVTLSFPATSPFKVKVLSSPHFLKIWLEVQPPPPPAERGCTLWEQFHRKQKWSILLLNNTNFLILYLLWRQSEFRRSLHFSWHLTPHSTKENQARKFITNKATNLKRKSERNTVRRITFNINQ